MEHGAHPLVAVDDEGVLSMPPETAAVLSSLREDLAVVCLAGPYRTGKSFLLNWLSQAPPGDGWVSSTQKLERGFEVGPNITACTRGLWMWPTSSTVRVDGRDMRVIYIDSEGLGAVGSDQQHDLNIFSLAVLASSLFMFNSVGAIEESSIAQLSFITQLSKHIHCRSQDKDGEDDIEDFEKFFPNFMWILRDFALELVDEDGEPMTEKQYLESALEPDPSFDDDAFEKNRVRELITTFFPRRDCCTLQRPAAEEADLARMHEGDVTSVRPGFRRQLEGLREKIFGMLAPKSLDGKPLNGSVLLAPRTAAPSLRAWNRRRCPTACARQRRALAAAGRCFAHCCKCTSRP